MQYDFEISPQELKELRQKETLQIHIIDVRTHGEFSLCAITPSKNIPLDELPRHLNNFNPDHQYVVICHHGIRSLQACLIMHQHGLVKTKSLKGGIDAWARCIDSSLPLY